MRERRKPRRSKSFRATPVRGRTREINYRNFVLTSNSITDVGVADASRRDVGIRPAVPVMAVVFLSFVIIGMALPVLPLHVHDVLGFGPFMVGSVAGCQFAAALISRL